MAAAVAGYACGWLLGYPELCLAAFGTLLALIAGVALLGPSPRLRVRREVAPARIARNLPGHRGASEIGRLLRL